MLSATADGPDQALFDVDVNRVNTTSRGWVTDPLARLTVKFLCNIALLRGC